MSSEVGFDRGFDVLAAGVTPLISIVSTRSEYDANLATDISEDALRRS